MCHLWLFMWISGQALNVMDKSWTTADKKSTASPIFCPTVAHNLPTLTHNHNAMRKQPDPLGCALGNDDKFFKD